MKTVVWGVGSRGPGCRREQLYVMTFNQSVGFENSQNFSVTPNHTGSPISEQLSVAVIGNTQLNSPVFSSCPVCLRNLLRLWSSWT